MKIKAAKWILIAALPAAALFSLNTKNIPPFKIIPKTDSINTITIALVGDLMCHIPQYEYSRVNSDSFDFRPVFRFVKPFLTSADMTMGNLETVTAGKGRKYSGYPLFNSPGAYINALKDSGFDFLFNSNNHAIDQGENGIIETINRLNYNKIKYAGAYISGRDRDSLRLITIKGITIAVLAYSYSTNGNPVPKGKKYLVSKIEEPTLKEEITKAKKFKPDLIMVYLHFGEEYQREPSRGQLALVKAIASYGADLIIGSHPHVLQPVLKLKGFNSRLDSVFVAFSLGNFFSNQMDRFKNSGVILQLTIEKNLSRDLVTLKDVSFMPTFVFKGWGEGKREFMILPAEISSDSMKPSFLSSKYVMQMQQSFEDSKEVLCRKYPDMKLIHFLLNKN